MASIEGKPTDSSEGISLSFEECAIRFNDFGISMSLAENWTEKRNARDAWTIRNHEILGLQEQTLDKFGRFIILAKDTLDTFSREGRIKYETQKLCNEKFTAFREKLDLETASRSLENMPTEAKSSTKQNSNSRNWFQNDLFTEDEFDSMMKQEREYMDKVNAKKVMRFKGLTLAPYVNGERTGPICNVTCTVLYEERMPLLIFRLKKDLSTFRKESLTERFRFQHKEEFITCYKETHTSRHDSKLEVLWTLKAVDPLKAKIIHTAFLDHCPGRNANINLDALQSNGHRSISRKMDEGFGRPQAMNVADSEPDNHICGERAGKNKTKSLEDEDGDDEYLYKQVEEKSAKLNDAQSRRSGQKPRASNKDMGDSGDDGNNIAIRALKKTGRCRDKRKKRRAV